MIVQFIYDSPEWAVTLTSVVIALVISSIGLVLTHAFTDRTQRNRHGELASFIVTNIAVLYSVLLAFIAVATWETFNQASEIAVTEANLAGNLFRDTSGLPQPLAGDLRAQIQQYLRIVIEKEWPVQREGELPVTGWAYLDRIGLSIASIIPANAGETVIMQEMLRGLNALYSARTSRLNAVQGHLPPLVWFVIAAVGALTIGFTCLVRSESLLVHMAMLAGLTVALTLVVVLIVELDYPFRGSISVSADAYRIVLEGLNPEISPPAK